MNPFLASIISDIIASILIDISSDLFDSPLSVIKDKRFWKKVLTKFFKQLKSGYTKFEAAENENLLLLDEEFLSHPIVKDEIKNCALSGEINKDRLREVYMSVRGSEPLELFYKNLDDACRVMDKVIKEAIPPEDLIIWERTQEKLKAIISGQSVTHKKLTGVEDSIEGIGFQISEVLKLHSESTSSHQYSAELIDEKIEYAVDRLRKSRFFPEFDRNQYSLDLAKELTEGKLSGGSAETRSRGLAWCARILSTNELEKAEECLQKAKELGASPKIKIAEAFILSNKGEDSQALSALAKINSPESRSASLVIVAIRKGRREALDWLKKANINIGGLDSEGKRFLLSMLLDLEMWDDANGYLSEIGEEDYRKTPFLHFVVAIIYLISTVPNDLRGVVLRAVPTPAKSFPLASDPESLASQRTAHKHFMEVVKTGEALQLPRAKTTAEEYALWLELRDPDRQRKGMERLRDRIKNDQSALRLVRMAVEFDLDIDLDAVEKEVEREIALNGEMTADAASARLVLAIRQPSPEEGAAYLSHHLDQLSKHIDNEYLNALLIEMYAKAGMSDQAEKALYELVQGGLPENEKNRLLLIVNEAKGIDPTEPLRQQFQQTDSTPDLLVLVDHLDRTSNWEELREYGKTLFRRTRDLRDAERVARAMYNLNQNEHLLEFLEGILSTIDLSENMQLLYCWALFLEGRLVEARVKLAGLEEDWDNVNFRILHIELNIATGQWEALFPIVSKELENKERRTADELLEVARLALYIDSPHAKELLDAATNTGGKDPVILANAYFLASTAGWENDPGIYHWLHEAARLSGDKGPIKKFSLRDIMDMKPAWDRHETKTWKHLQRGEIPMFMAAESLNKSLVNLFLLPALANQNQTDPRRIIPIPAYSGKVLSKPFDIGGIAGLDATALLTLGLLDLLEVSFDAFETIYIPHTTLSWLFSETQKAAFHQPSQVDDAKMISNLLATNAIRVIQPSCVPDRDLAEEVGEDLALLITEATNIIDDDSPQRLVVRSAPVHILASMMEEEADMSAYQGVICNCQAIVDKLKLNGYITVKDHEKAQDYLELQQEKSWPNQPEIADDAVLYLDDVAVSHFLHLGLLENLLSAGFDTYITKRKLSEINSLISYDEISDKAIQVLVRIRASIKTRIESGKIKTGRLVQGEFPHGGSLRDHPSRGVFDLAPNCDLIISDDRFINRHAVINDNGPTPIISTLDLIKKLSSEETILQEDLLDYMTILRRSGYIFVPLDTSELVRHLKSSTVVGSKVVECAELKAIKENILKVRMSDWLQLPEEASWLDLIMNTLIQAIEIMWRDGDNIELTRVRSNWLLGLIEIRGWSHSIVNPEGVNVVDTTRRAYIDMLLIPPDDIPTTARTEYLKWIDETVLAPIKELEPDLFAWLVERKKALIANLASKLESEEDTE